MVTTLRPDTPHVPASPNTTGLVRRLTILCPVTSRAADTGYEITGMPNVAGGTQVLVDCLECGQDHEWTADDTQLP
jgi:hypothetical protein